MGSSNRIGTLLVGALLGAVVIGVGLLLTVYLGGWQTDTEGQPSWIEASLARAAVNASVKRHAPVVPNPVPMTDSTVRMGMRIYRGNCAGCHGGPSGSPSPFGTGFYPRPPQFVIAKPTRSGSELFFLIKHGVRRTGMPAWRTIMSDEDIWHVVTFLQRIDSLSPAIDSAWKAPRK